MWRKQVTANDLRIALPEVALKMETIVHCHELRSQSIKFKVLWRAGYKNVVLVVQGTLNREIRISPVDKGANSVGEWNTYMMPPRDGQSDSDYENHFPEYSIRAYVEIVDKSDSDSPEVFSFTLTGRNMEDLLRGTIGYYKKCTNIEMDLVTTDRRSR